ncbi:MAG: choice-of-anchor J domain-containing protein, partial [Muribaculaceae bacterium]|nr:choice-of-anchor J domain-containing protein [Muribaculaceae bacterium]
QAPEGATAVAAVADADGAISATVSWTLPTLDVKGNPLSTIEAVEVLRDDAVAATLAGTATTWTDTEATGLTAGTHTYAIRIKANGLESELSEAVTVKVGPWDYAPADFSGWTSFTTSGNNWVTNSNKPSGSLQSGSMRIWAASQINNIDSWLTSPRLGMVAGKTYKLKFKYLVWYDDAAVIEHFRGHLATEIPNADNSATIAASPAFLELDNLVKGSNSSDWREVSITIAPTEGQQYVTFHVFGNYCKCILISDLSIETYAEKPFVPAAPTDLKATAGANHALTVALEWTNPTRDTEGELFGADKTIDNILVYRDGALAATLEGTATSWTDSEANGLTAGDHTYAVSAVVAGVESALSEEAEVTNVGPLQPLDPVLWESNFATDGNEFATLWCTYAGTGNMGGSWIYNSSNKRIQLMNAYGYNEDAWLMTPPFIFKPRQYYTLTIEGYCTSDEHPLTLALVEDAANPSVSQYIINQTKPDADHTMTLDTEAGTKTFEFYFYPLKPTAAKMQHAPYNPDVPRYIAIHANNSGIGANTFIHSIKIEEVAGKLTGIEEVATDDAPVAIEVYDITGRKLGNASSTQLEEYAAGAYIIRAISADGSSATKKIIR